MEAIGYSCPRYEELYQLPLGKDFSISVCRSVYEPSDDSFLAIEAIDSNKAGPLVLCIDVGSGTGIIGLYCGRKLKPSYIILLDLNPCAVYCSKHNAGAANLSIVVDVVQCDNITCLREGIRNILLVYNTPYLPVSDEGLAGLAWSGGLKEARRVVAYAIELVRSGCMIVVYSSLSGSDSEILSRLKEAGYRVSMRTVHIFFEDIKAVIACRGEQ